MAVAIPWRSAAFNAKALAVNVSDHEKKFESISIWKSLDVSAGNDGGAYTRCLDDLCESGFVRKYTAMGCKAKGAVYQLIDNFTLFHFRFIEGRENPDEHLWTLSLKTPTVAVWRGLAFERRCLWHVPQIKQALGISGVLAEVYAWRREPDDVRPWGVQIDLLLDRADQVVNVCEMKYVVSAHKSNVSPRGADFRATGRRHAAAICP